MEHTATLRNNTAPHVVTSSQPTLYASIAKPTRGSGIWPVCRMRSQLHTHTRWTDPRHNREDMTITTTRTYCGMARVDKKGSICNNHMSVWHVDLQQTQDCTSDCRTSLWRRETTCDALARLSGDLHLRVATVHQQIIGTSHEHHLVAGAWRRNHGS
jgi:hypothetical protein